METQAGDTYAVYLCGRPLPNRGRCVLGRETAIQKMVWGSDDWLRTLDGSGLPELETPAPALPAAPFRRCRRFARTSTASSCPSTSSGCARRIPKNCSALSARPGYLRLYGRETIGSVFRQSLVARRQQAHCYSVITAMEFEPAHFQQAAGLVCYYNSSKFHYLHVSHDEEHGRHLRVMSCVPDLPQSDFFTAPIPIPAGPHRTARRSGLRAPALRVPHWRQAWNWLPELFDASALSDECTGPGSANFTGAFVGMACQDMSGTAHPADFDYFEYREREYQRSSE